MNYDHVLAPNNIHKVKISLFTVINHIANEIIING